MGGKVKKFMPQRMHGIRSTHEKFDSQQQHNIPSNQEFLRMEESGMGVSGHGGNSVMGPNDLNTLLAQKMLIESKINEINHNQFRGEVHELSGGQQQQLLTNNERTNLNMRPPTCPPIFSGHWHTNSLEGTPQAFL